MKKFIIIFFISLFLATFGIHSVLAAKSDTEIDVGVLQVFIGTVILAVFIGLILFYMAKKEREIRADHRRITSTRSAFGSLNEAIANQIDAFYGPGKNREEAAGAILNIVNEKLEEKASQVKIELDQKYKQLINQKSEEIVTIKGKYTWENTAALMKEHILAALRP